MLHVINVVNPSKQNFLPLKFILRLLLEAHEREPHEWLPVRIVEP
jgi:hypothetical protein